MYAVIDIGSNTIRMSVYKAKNNRIKTMFNNKFMIGLAGYINKDGVLIRKGIERAVDALLDFKKVLENIEVNKVYTFATASLRNIKNTDEAVKIITEKTGFNIDVISGEQEATLDFFGATFTSKLDEGLLIDIGGGSTELVFFKDKEILNAVSLPIGSLNLSTNFVSNLIPDKDEQKVIEDFVLSKLKQIKMVSVNTDHICGIGGTVRGTRKLSNDIFPKSNKKIKTNEIQKLLDIFDNNEKETLMTILKIVPERVHTIVTGMIILNTISKYYKSKSITVSNFGLREGYLYNKLTEEGIFC